MQRGPSARRMVSTTSVSRLSVPLTIRNALIAPSRSICSTMTSDAGRPKTTSSMAPNTTRPLCTLVLPGHFGFVADRVAEEFGNVMPEDDAETAPSQPVLYGRYASPFVRRVAVTLRLYGIDYRHVPLMPFGPDKTELAKFNPIARVPALQLADGEMLIDSTVILDHLDQVVGPQRSLTPAAG